CFHWDSDFDTTAEMLRFTYILFICIAIPSIVLTQGSRRLSRDTVAWVVGVPITSADLRARIELMPWPEPIRPSTADSIKSHALWALIAERLLATEALIHGVGSTDHIGRLRRGLFRALLKDELYHREVAGRDRPNPAQISEGLRRYRENRSVLALLVTDEPVARALVTTLRASRDRDSILVTLGPDRILDRDTLDVSFGNRDTVLENAAYGIDRSAVSQPILVATQHWMVFVLVGRSPNPTAAKQDAEEQAHSVSRILQQRLDALAAERFYRAALGVKRAQADSTIFNVFAEAVTAVWSTDAMRFHRSEGYQITSEMVDVLHEKLAGVRERPLVTLEDGALSLEDVVEMFRYETFVSPELSGELFQSRLNEAVRMIVGGEYLARAARERHLENAVGLRNDMRTWTDHWAAGEFLRRMRDTVLLDRRALVEYLVEHREEYRGRAAVWIEEVLSITAVDAATVLDAIGKGTSVSELASARGRRTTWVSSNGSSGWFDPAIDPVVGFHALLADSGTVVGPVHVEEGISTFRVLGVRMSHGMLQGDSLGRHVEPIARADKSRRTVNSTLAGLARRHGVRVDAEAVRRMPVTLLPMFTRRYLGFGGSMNGAPMLIPLWDWVKQLPPELQWP
ncbi:MAG: hypothetical protein AABY75_07970, partial [Bacteroidota bacterium]